MDTLLTNEQLADAVRLRVCERLNWEQITARLLDDVCGTAMTHPPEQQRRSNWWAFRDRWDLLEQSA